MDIRFENLQGNSDMDKQVEMKPVEQIVTDEPIKNAVDVTDVQLITQKTSDLYHGILYTVVPVETDLEEDITPDVQGFEKRRVLLWDDFNSLYKFDESIWKKLVVQIPRDLLGKKVWKEIGDVYSTKIISVGWSK